MPRAKKLKLETHSAQPASIADLRPHPRNYRDHPVDQIEHIKASLREHGFYRNVVVAKDDTILAGHGVVKACLELGIKDVMVVRLPIDPDSPQALKLLAGDNAIAGLALDDDRALTNLLKELADEGNLLGTGYDEMQLAALLMVSRPVSEIEDHDAAAEWVGMPDYEPGEKSLNLTITFPTKEDRGQFIEEYGIKVDYMGDKRAWSTRWPWSERKDPASVRFESA